MPQASPKHHHKGGWGAHWAEQGLGQQPEGAGHGLPARRQISAAVPGPAGSEPLKLGSTHLGLTETPGGSSTHLGRSRLVPSVIDSDNASVVP